MAFPLCVRRFSLLLKLKALQELQMTWLFLKQDEQQEIKNT